METYYNVTPVDGSAERIGDAEKQRAALNEKFSWLNDLGWLSLVMISCRDGELCYLLLFSWFVVPVHRKWQKHIFIGSYFVIFLVALQL